MVTITVIMPVYNDEKYVAQSIESVLNQKLKNIELICVNDGSTDNSGCILNEYSKKYPFIKVIHQENQGAANCRNKAILKAKGKYITFLDSDDFYLDENALKKMYQTAIKNDADMVSANIKSLNKKGKLVTNYNLAEFSKQGVMKPKDYGIPWTFGKNIYKKSFLHKNKFIFPKYARGEDPVFLAKILTTVKKIYFVPVYLMGIRDATYHGLYKIDNYEKKWGYIKHFHDTFKILDNGNLKNMRKRYELKLFEFINFSRNFADKEIYEMVQEIFSDDKYFLKKCEKYFHFEKPKISIIIPFTGKTKFLDDQINDILSFNMKDLEFIFVGCGKRDYSDNVLNDFVKKDFRAKLIYHKYINENFIKNLSIDFANGEYILFLNPEDKIENNKLKKLYKHAKQNDSDLVLFNINNKTNKIKSNLKKTYKNKNLNKYSFTFWGIKDSFLISSFTPWTKLYKKELFENINDFYFISNNSLNYISLHVQSIIQSKKISFFDEIVYKQSNTNLILKDSFNSADIFNQCDIIKKFLIDVQVYDELTEEFKLFKITQIIKYITIANSPEYYNLARKELSKMDFNKENDSEMFKKYSFILNNNSFEDYKSFDNELRVSKLNNELLNLEEKYDKILNKNNKLKNKLNKNKKKNKELFNSNSWKITKPLRDLKN